MICPAQAFSYGLTASWPRRNLAVSGPLCPLEISTVVDCVSHAKECLGTSLRT